MACQQIRRHGGGNFSPIDGIPVGCHVGFTTTTGAARARHPHGAGLAWLLHLALSNLLWPRRW